MMRQILSFIVALSLLMSVTLLYAASPKKGAPVIPSRYIVVFKENIDTDKTADNFLRRFSGLEVNLRYRHALRGMAVKIPEQLLSRIAADPSVAYIEPDVVVTLNAQVLPTPVLATIVVSSAGWMPLA